MSRLLWSRLGSRHRERSARRTTSGGARAANPDICDAAVNSLSPVAASGSGQPISDNTGRGWSSRPLPAPCAVFAPVDLVTTGSWNPRNPRAVESSHPSRWAAEVLAHQAARATVVRDRVVRRHGRLRGSRCALRRALPRRFAGDPLRHVGYCPRSDRVRLSLGRHSRAAATCPLYLLLSGGIARHRPDRTPRTLPVGDRPQAGLQQGIQHSEPLVHPRRSRGAHAVDRMRRMALPSRRDRRMASGRGRGSRGWEPATLVVVACLLPVWMCVQSFFHPQDLLAMGLALCAMACACHGRWAGAGVLVALAVLAQQFTLLVAVPARPRSRQPEGSVCGSGPRDRCARGPSPHGADLSSRPRPDRARDRR